MKRVCIILLITSAWVFTNTSKTALAQCISPPRALPETRFLKNATVTVTIDTDFSPEEKQEIQNAFQTWNSHKAINCSNVTFVGFQQGAETSANNTTYVKFDNSRPAESAINTFTIGQGFKQSLITVFAHFRDGNTSDLSRLGGTMRHEIGHSFNLDNSTLPGTIMYEFSGTLAAITPCDDRTIKCIYCPTSFSTESSNCELHDGQWNTFFCECEDNNPPSNCIPFRCTDNNGEGTGCYFDPSCCCCECSPIIIDTLGNGLSLTDMAGGVFFDLKNEDTPRLMSWTAFGSDDAFLSLDRNGSGTIDNGEELFGSFTPQPASDEPNGFIALAEYDNPANGGNLDSKIDSSDVVFSSLRLWRDTNHNGISEAAELYTLPTLGVVSIELNYKNSRRQDEFGNKLRYRAKVKDARGGHVGRWAWDVFLKVSL